jgi:hypothetical protein
MADIPNRFGDGFGEDQKLRSASGGDSGNLAGWCMRHVQRGRDVRDTKYAGRWREYTRLSRGFYADEDKNTDSERSKLIAPALQQAVEMTVAEMEEAVFGKSAWFDITDDIRDENKDDAIDYRDQLHEDFALDGVADAISKSFLMGAIYGTGIAKINVSKKQEKSIVDGKSVSIPRVAVTVECIRPDEFVIDPSALTVDEAFFCAHEMIKPLHGIKEKIRAGTYRNVTVAPWNGQKSDTDGTGLKASVDSQDGGILITEYFGKVPASMIPDAKSFGQLKARSP